MHIHYDFYWIYTGVPTLRLLTCFQILIDCRKKNLNIIQRTSANYAKLAMFLLNDDNCDIVDSLKGNPEEIVITVYKKWISGSGRRPVTWQTLVEVLREIELNCLADEIETALNL